LPALGRRFVGVDPGFLATISDGRGVPARYARLLDYLQYNNPPFNQYRLAEELGIPQPSISRVLARLRSRGVRVRQDIDLNKLGLKTVFAFYEGRLLTAVPAVDWVASAWWVNNGTLLVYRVPPEHKGRLLDVLSEKLGEPSEVVGVRSSFLAKPSIEHYFAGAEELDPVSAVKALEKHPPVPSRVVGFPEGEAELRYREPRALELLSYLEHDVIEAKRLFARRWSLKLYNFMMRRVSGALRGARVMFLDRGGALVFARVESSRACSEHVARILAVYPYATNLFLADDGDLIAVFMMPFGYWNNVLRWLLGLCDGPGATRFKIHVTSLSGGLVRQYIPWRNYDKSAQRWSFDDAPKLTLVRLARRGVAGSREASGLYEWSVEEYVRRLAETMGADYVASLLPQLPKDVRKIVEDALAGMQTRSEGDDNP
jgi:DNA-binding Lrp family transcriptional regulator